MVCRKTYRAQWYQANKERAQLTNRINHLKTKFGLSLDDYNNMLLLQNNACAICKKPETAKEKRSGKTKLLAVDHCHTTGKVRKLLCMRCNHVLGASEESLEYLDKVKDYIKEHK